MPKAAGDVEAPAEAGTEAPATAGSESGESEQPPPPDYLPPKAVAKAVADVVYRAVDMVVHHDALVVCVDTFGRAAARDDRLRPVIYPTEYHVFIDAECIGDAYRAGRDSAMCCGLNGAIQRAITQAPTFTAVMRDMRDGVMHHVAQGVLGMRPPPGTPGGGAWPAAAGCTVWVGVRCMQGRHRSVAIAELGARCLRLHGFRVEVRHRHMGGRPPCGCPNQCQAVRARLRGADPDEIDATVEHWRAQGVQAFHAARRAWFG
ncbi:MAG: hypothetical protein GY772_31550 [bacterium]|nr:hypothetical protein [bacterium]